MRFEAMGNRKLSNKEVGAVLLFHVLTRGRIRRPLRCSKGIFRGMNFAYLRDGVIIALDRPNTLDLEEMKLQAQRSTRYYCALSMLCAGDLAARARRYCLPGGFLMVRMDHVFVLSDAPVSQADAGAFDKLIRKGIDACKSRELLGIACEEEGKLRYKMVDIRWCFGKYCLEDAACG